MSSHAFCILLCSSQPVSLSLASSFHSPFKTGTFQVRIKQIKRPSLPEKPFLAIDSPQSLWIESTHAAYGSPGQESGTTTSTIDLMGETHQWIQEPNQHLVTKCLYLTSLHMHIVYTQCILHKHLHVFGQKYLCAIIQKFCIPRTEFSCNEAIKNYKRHDTGGQYYKEVARIYIMNVL